MKLYEITIQPVSGFGTALKGDTLFGHFCWQVAHDPSLLEGGLGGRISTYEKMPFVVFSSAFPKLEYTSTCYVLKRPDVPMSFLFPLEVERKDRIIKAKEHKKRKWMALKEGLVLDLSKASFMTDRELFEAVEEKLTRETRRQMRKVGFGEFIKTFSQPHNTIHRLTQTTGTGPFAPYSREGIYYYPETELVVFVLIDESATDIDRVCIALERIGLWGYGRDASTGMGHFKLGKHNELPIPNTNSANACYTLAPSVPDSDSFKASYFTPFVRFGKHGDRLAYSANPFKNPVIMADEGAVFLPKDDTFFEKPFLGKAITGVSKSMPESVVQGYAPYLPLKLER